MDLAERVLVFFRESGLLATTGVVAVSGGPDSVALAHALNRLHTAGHFPRLVLGHVNHQLRGADSDADEAFVLGLAAPPLVCRTTRLDVQAMADAAGANLEDAARRARYAWLAEVAAAEGAVWVATGHTADDQAETVLFRLLRGAGLHGLGGMASLRPLASGIELVRPLLTTSRADVLAYLDQHAQPFREDASNLDLARTRNRLRHELLPLLRRDYNPAVSDVLCRLAEQARAAQTDLSTGAAALLSAAELPRAGAVLVFRLAALTDQPLPLLGEAMRQVWRREGWPLDGIAYPDWQRLADVIRGQPPAWNFPGGIHARHVSRVLQLHPLAG